MVKLQLPLMLSPSSSNLSTPTETSLAMDALNQNAEHPYQVVVNRQAGVSVVSKSANEATPRWNPGVRTFTPDQKNVAHIGHALQEREPASSNRNNYSIHGNELMRSIHAPAPGRTDRDEDIEKLKSRIDELQDFLLRQCVQQSLEMAKHKCDLDQNQAALKHEVFGYTKEAIAEAHRTELQLARSDDPSRLCSPRVAGSNPQPMLQGSDLSQSSKPLVQKSGIDMGGAELDSQASTLERLPVGSTADSSLALKTDARRQGAQDSEHLLAVPQQLELPATTNTAIQTAEIVPVHVGSVLSNWIPYGVRGLPQFQHHGASNNQETFLAPFLVRVLGGKSWSPGFFHNPDSSVKSFWVLNSDLEPFAPKVPCMNGAKLTAFFNNTICPDTPDEEAYNNAPVFVSITGSSQAEFLYMGSYSTTRMSDKVGYDTMREHIPISVLEYWAKNLASAERPEWCTKALVNHLWPMDEYTGPTPTDLAIATEQSEATVSNFEEIGGSDLEKHVQRGLQAWAKDLASWKKESNMKATMLKEENLLEAFFAADADLEPGLRLWWEYLQCTGYDDEFYHKLVSMKQAEDATMQSRGAIIAKGVAGASEPNTHSGPLPPHLAATARSSSPKSSNIAMKAKITEDLAAAKKFNDGATKAKLRTTRKS